MLSKNKIKFIKSLQQKKFRNEHQKFIIEGRKGVLALLDSGLKIEEVFCSQGIVDKYSEINQLNPVVVAEELIEKASGLINNKEAIAIVHQSNHKEINWEKEVLYLDGVSDPGNLGTIIRTAEWFGIEQVVCSTDCVDFFNPKVIQSTMGAYASKQPIVFGLKDFLAQKPIDVPVYLTAFDGDSPNVLSGLKKGVLVMGSESHGVSSDWGKEVIKITIPAHPDTKAESLNVGIATSILCYQIKQG